MNIDEIKFRGVSVETPARFVYGFVFAVNGRAYIKPADSDKRFGTGIEVHPDSICLWSTMKDSNNEDIYEGDEIEYTLPGLDEAELTTYTETVEFEDGCFMLDGVPLSVIYESDGSCIGKIVKRPISEFL